MELVSVLVGVVIGLFGFLGFILIALWGDNREMTKRRKTELAAETERDYRKRIEFSSHNEKKELIKMALREFEQSKMPLGNGGGSQKLESALARDVRMNPSKFGIGVGAIGVGQDRGEKAANPAMFSSHKPSCPNHPMNRNRVGGKNVPRQMGVEVHMIEVPEFLIDSLIEMQNESSTKNPRTNVRKKAGTKSTTNARSKVAKKRSRSKS